MRGLKFSIHGRNRRRSAKSRIPYGMRGLKYANIKCRVIKDAGRIPYGMRGLKLPGRQKTVEEIESHPIRDAWIEICRGCGTGSG